MQEQQIHCTIAIFGLFGSPNLGNEATLAAFLQYVRRRQPDVRILMIAPRRSGADQTNGLRWLQMDPMPVEPLFWRVKPGWLRRGAAALATVITEPFRRRRAASQLQDVNILFVPGTGIVDDFGQGPLDVPLHLDRWTAAAKAVGARVIFCSIGASMVRSALSRRLFLRSLRRAAYCSFRDDASRDNARALGMPDALVVPDLAFGLQRVQVKHEAQPGARRTVGVGVMGYFGWNLGGTAGERVYLTYIAQMQSLTDRLLHSGYAVRLLIGDTVADARAVHDLSAHFAHDSRVIAAPIENYADLVDQIMLCDIVVATRYHNVLFALMAARPTISIGYSDKNDALMRSTGQAAYVHAIDGFNVDTVAAQISEIAARGSAHGAELHIRAQQMRRQVSDPLDTLLAAALTECERSSRSAR